jgi:hypothetical protein
MQTLAFQLHQLVLTTVPRADSPRLVHTLPRFPMHAVLDCVPISTFPHVRLTPTQQQGALALPSAVTHSPAWVSHNAEHRSRQRNGERRGEKGGHLTAGTALQKGKDDLTIGSSTGDQQWFAGRCDDMDPPNGAHGYDVVHTVTTKINASRRYVWNVGKCFSYVQQCLLSATVTCMSECIVQGTVRRVIRNTTQLPNRRKCTRTLYICSQLSRCNLETMQQTPSVTS